MSVIAYYKGEVGCDTMGYCQATGIWLPQRKLFGWQDRLWGAFCGKEPPLETANNLLAIMQTIIGYMEHSDIERYVVDDTIDESADKIFKGLESAAQHTAFFVSKHRCYYISEDVRVEAVDPRVPAFGGSSGVVAASGLLYGLKMQKAIELALQIGPLSRGEPIVQNAKKLKTIRNTVNENKFCAYIQQRSKQ